MTQSSFIAGALIAGFVLYLAAKGRLPVYTAVLWGPVAKAPEAKTPQGVTAKDMRDAAMVPFSVF